MYKSLNILISIDFTENSTPKSTPISTPCTPEIYPLTLSLCVVCISLYQFNTHTKSADFPRS